MKKRRKLSRKGKIKVAIRFAMLCVFLLVCFLIIKTIFGFIGKIVEKSSAEVSGDVVVSSLMEDSVIDEKEEEKNESETELTESQMAEYISKHTDIYPQYLRNFCKTYPQTTEFVYDYPEKKSLGVAENIDISDDYKSGEIPLFIQWDERWGYADYGNGIIGTSGCGPTCLAMVYVGLTGDTSYNPQKMCAFSEGNGYYLKGSGTSWSLMDYGANKLGLQSEMIGESESVVKNHLQNGHPIIVSVSEGDFTVGGHFIVLAGLDGDQIIVNDPNSKENSNKRWSWSRIAEQTKGMWAFSK